MLFSLFLIAVIISGQIVKFPSGSLGGLTFLDLAVIILDILGLIQIHFKLQKANLIILAALSFLVVGFLSLLFTPLKLSWTEYILSAGYGFRFFIYLLFTWLLLSGSLAGVKKNTYSILFFSGLGLALLGILQLIFLPNLKFLSQDFWDPHYFRTVSTLLDPNFAGVYFALTLILLIQKGRKTLKLRWMIPSFLILYFALATTFSRSAWLMFTISILTLSLLKKSPKLGILTIASALTFWLTFNLYHQEIAVPKNIDRTKSAGFRFNSWEQGFKVFERSPILGSGFNSYRYALREYQLGDQQFLQSRGSSTNDSSLLYVLATTGITGLIFYLIFLLSLLYTAYKTFLLKNSWGALLFSAILGLTANSFFINSLFYPWFLFWIMAVFSHIKIPAQEDQIK